MTSLESSALLLSLFMGICSVAIGIIPAVSIAWLLARRSFWGKTIIEALVFLPLVIPPVVTGYVMLILLGRKSLLGEWLVAIGIEIPFTWAGMALAGAVMGFPLIVRTVRGSFEGVDPRLESAARTLGYSRWRTFFSLTLPLSWPGVLAGSVLCFARALGEFGATVMMSPGTDGYRTIPLEIFRSYQAPGQEEAVFRLALASITISIVALAMSEALIQRYRSEKGKIIKATG